MTMAFLGIFFSILFESERWLYLKLTLSRLINYDGFENDVSVFGCFFCGTCFSLGDLGVQVSVVRPSVRPFVHPSTFIKGVL